MFFVFLITTLILNYIILSDGVSVEEMAAEVNKRTDALENAQRELRDRQSLNRALKHSIKRRLLKWHDFRRHIALRCKIYFQFHLSQRGYYGKVLFDHPNEQLQLKVSSATAVGCNLTASNHWCNSSLFLRSSGTNG